MRREGDLLVAHLATAREEVVLCAPFIKAGVLRRVLGVIPSGAKVRVITRWHALEIASGVSDLEVFDIARARQGVSLSLLDGLHAKIYSADGRVLAGSANLTAKALGWCANPNLEVLTPVDPDCASIANCLAALSGSRPADDGTVEQSRNRVGQSPALLAKASHAAAGRAQEVHSRAVAENV